jgi:hypothetical protein
MDPTQPKVLGLEVLQLADGASLLLGLMLLRNRVFLRPRLEPIDGRS